MRWVASRISMYFASPATPTISYGLPSLSKVTRLPMGSRYKVMGHGLIDDRHGRPTLSRKLSRAPSARRAEVAKYFGATQLSMTLRISPGLA